MIIGGMNFVLMAWALRRRANKLFSDEELRAYLAILAVATLAVAANLVATGTEHHPGRALQLSAFQVASVMTTTGFATADFNQWPTLSKIILIAVMLVGGCTGSTSGSVKVSRIILFAKTVSQQAIRSFRPSQVFRCKLNGRPVEDSEVNQAVFFVALTFWIIVLGATAVALFEPELDPLTAVTSITATLLNVGPGLEVVGPMGNFSTFSPPTLLLLSLLMILGRLEFFAILALFVPSLWRRY
jgi:trk system potassium uptake protein TrkH